MAATTGFSLASILSTTSGSHGITGGFNFQHCWSSGWLAGRALAGVEADLHVYEAMSHAGYAIWTDTPESRDMYSEVGAFLAGHLD